MRFAVPFVLIFARFPCSHSMLNFLRPQAPQRLRCNPVGCASGRPARAGSAEAHDARRKGDHALRAPAGWSRRRSSGSAFPPSKWPTAPWACARGRAVRLSPIRRTNPGEGGDDLFPFGRGDGCNLGHGAGAARRPGHRAGSEGAGPRHDSRPHRQHQSRAARGDATSRATAKTLISPRGSASLTSKVCRVRASFLPSSISPPTTRSSSGIASTRHIDERTLHEIYLPAFKAAVQEARRVDGDVCL